VLLTNKPLLIHIHLPGGRVRQRHRRDMARQICLRNSAALAGAGGASMKAAHFAGVPGVTRTHTIGRELLGTRRFAHKTPTKQFPSILYQS
jgi:hypothetical protein